MMEQGSLADLLTLAKSGDDNKLGEMMAMMNGGMGGQQWMWWILIILFAFGGFGNGMFGRNMAPNGLDNANQLILEKLNGMSVEQCGQFSRVGNGICDSTYAITNAVRDARDAASACCCETNLNIERASNANQRATDALSHQLFRLLLPDAAPYAGSCYWYSGTGYGQSVPEPAGILRHQDPHGRQPL